MCSSASSLVLFTTVLELPLAMMLAADVLLVIDRQLQGAERCRRREGGGIAWAGCGSPSNGLYPLAWVRCGAEFYLPVPLVALPLSVSSLCSFFLPFLSYTTQARTRISVYICPFCINALDLREIPSRLDLHNNALSLRESTSRLGLHNNALDLHETLSRLGLHNNALDLRETPSQLGLHKCPLLGVHKCP